MANLRHSQFYRNLGSASFNSYDELLAANSGIISIMEDAKSGLHDGEIILGRYTVKGVSGVVVGVARVSNNTVSLDYIFDRNLNDHLVNEVLDERIGQLASTNHLVEKTTATVDGSGNGVKYSFGTLLTQDNGINEVTGTEDLYFKSAPTSSNYIVTSADISGIVGAMYYKGTVSYENSTLTPSPSTSSVTGGDVYIASSPFTLSQGTTFISGTVPAGNYEAGDMFIYNGSGWNVVSGENQYTFNPTTVEVGTTEYTTIGTIDGGAIQIRVTDKYMSLASNLDADNMSGDNLVTPTTDFKVLNSVVESQGVLTMGTAYNLKKLAATGAASDASITSISGLVSTNVQGALEELNTQAGNNKTTINSLTGDFIIGSSMLTVDNSHRVIDVKTNSPYIGTNDDGSLTIQHVDTNGNSTVGTDIASVNTVQTYISSMVAALDGTVDADNMSGNNLKTPDDDFKVLNSVVEENGVITMGTAYSLKKLAASGEAIDVTIEDADDHFTSGDVEGALAELYDIASGAASTTSSVSKGDGITISSSTSSGNTDYNVAVDLGAYSLSTDTNEYHTNVDNLLRIATDGKLSISDTWDCGTY